MLAKLLAIFIAVPLIELAILIKIGKAIGVWETVWIVVATAAVGAFLARREGLSAMISIQSDLSAGRMPSQPILDGLMILVGAAMLLTPGLLTDAAGFFLIIPQTRRLIKQLAVSRLERKMNIKMNIIDIDPDNN